MTDAPVVTATRGGETRVLYQPTPKQLEFHARSEPNVLLWGGRGSGKSTALRWDAHLRALLVPGFSYIILRRTYPELLRSHLKVIADEMAWLGGSYHATNRIAQYPNGSKGYFGHCQSEADVHNLLSAEFGWAGFDELSTFEWDMFLRLAASTRVTAGSGLTAMVRAVTNPLGASAEQIYRYFILKDVSPDEDPDYHPDDWYAIQANLEDNPHVDAEQYRKRFAGLPEYVRRAWLQGEFAMEHQLFDITPKTLVVETIPTIGDRPLVAWVP